MQLFHLGFKLPSISGEEGSVTVNVGDGFAGTVGPRIDKFIGAVESCAAGIMALAKAHDRFTDTVQRLRHPTHPTRTNEGLWMWQDR